MKLFIAIIFCFLVLGVDSQRVFQFMKEAGQGTRDMWRAYSDMKEANWKNSDKYFHARGNYDAVKRGPGGAWAAKVISDAREGIQRFTGHGAADSRADQFANKWGRSALRTGSEASRSRGRSRELPTETRVRTGPDPWRVGSGSGSGASPRPQAGTWGEALFS
ncbi:serum amyloid A 3 [Cricetulus griseus]